MLTVCLFCSLFLCLENKSAGKVESDQNCQSDPGASTKKLYREEPRAEVSVNLTEVQVSFSFKLDSNTLLTLEPPVEKENPFYKVLRHRVCGKASVGVEKVVHLCNYFNFRFMTTRNNNTLIEVHIKPLARMVSVNNPHLNVSIRDM